MSREEDFLSQINSAVDSLRIHGTSAYSWCGVRHQFLPRKLRASLTKEDMHACVVSIIERQLYEEFYSVGGVSADTETLKVAGAQTSSPRFLEKLSEANHGDDHFDPGWCVLSATDGTLRILKDGLRLTALCSDCQSDEDVVQGVTVSLRTAKECFGMTPGFYLVIGSAAGTVRDASGILVRLYWNVTATGAVELVDELTQFLNDRRIGFRLKVLSDPSAYARCDAAVLYLSKNDVVSVWDELTGVYERIRGHIKHGVPALTKQLAPGLGLAEDPDGSTSFGLHRCKLIAEGLIGNPKPHKNDPEIRLKNVIDRFNEEGVKISRPYLNPGSVDDYPSFISRQEKRQLRDVALRSGDRLEAAIEIGRRITACAVHNGEKCTWAGYFAPPTPEPTVDRSSVFGTIGPNLYAGDCGIAWFLSELYAETKDDTFAECALAALRGAAVVARSLPNSLFSGWTGVAVATAYGSRLLNSPDLGKVSLELVNRLSDSKRLRPERDLLNGEAGIIAGLLVLARLLETDSLAKEAALLGENLIKNAERRDGARGCSWSSGKKQNHPNLTGLSHGASGVALALFKLYGATGRSEFRDLALEGSLYEKALFDPAKGNWPDLRYVRKSANGSTDQHQFPSFWCHGAPGIAMSRLAGWRHSRENACLDEARLAFRSTHDWCSRAIDQDQAVGCLCHGLAGNAMILLYAEELGEDKETVRHTDLARSIAGNVAYKVLLRERLFGDAMHDVDNPSLMLGLAGIGHYLLHSVSASSSRLISPLWLE